MSDLIQNVVVIVRKQGGGKLPERAMHDNTLMSTNMQAQGKSI